MLNIAQFINHSTTKKYKHFHFFPIKNKKEINFRNFLAVFVINWIRVNAVGVMQISNHIELTY